MPVYTYSALDARGKATKGVINADSARAARVKLRQAGLFTKELLETESAETPERHRGLELLQMVRRGVPAGVTGGSAPAASPLAGHHTASRTLHPPRLATPTRTALHTAD